MKHPSVRRFVTREAMEAKIIALSEENAALKARIRSLLRRKQGPSMAARVEQAARREARINKLIPYAGKERT